MMRIFVSVLGVALLAGCASNPNNHTTNRVAAVFNKDCNYIGCQNGGLVHYPHEQFGATRQLKRWYGWDWGKTSSAHKPGSPEYERLKLEEISRLRSMGLDPMGRPLRQ